MRSFVRGGETGPGADHEAEGGLARLLVCGGAGFIGSALVRLAVARGDTVTVLDKLTYATPDWQNLPDDPSIRAVQGDICDERLVEQLASDSDAIVNLAAETHVDRSIMDATAFLRTGVEGVHVLLEAARLRGIRLVQVSTDEVYGPQRTGAARESSPLVPSSPYAAAKAAGDLIVRSYVRTHRVDAVITRGSNTYGPRQHVEKFVPLTITSGLTRRPVPVYGDGLQRRSWLYVDDHAAAILMALDRARPGSVLNIPGEEMANRDLATDLLAAVSAPISLLTPVPDRPGHDARYAVDGGRLARLGWRRAVRWPQGRDATVAWYASHPERWQRQLADPYFGRQYPSLA